MGFVETQSHVEQSSGVKADALLELGDRIVELAAHLHAATHRMLMLLADFEERGGWKAGGHRSCAYWLAYHTGFDLGACREKVRAARSLASLPLTSEAMSKGELSFAKVRALTRVATEDNEAELLEFARAGTARHVERLVRGWKSLSRTDENERARLLHQSRTVSIVPDEDGMYVLRGRLDPEVGALLMRAIEAASDALYRKESQQREEITSAQRRADAMALLAERGLRAGFATDDNAPLSGSRAERYQVVLHVEESTLAAAGEPGKSHLADGTRVSAETSRRLCCDGSVVRIRTDGGGRVLNVGRRTRTIPPAIRRALEFRDAGCRFPGCGSRFTDGHHVVHWADGGETKVDNLVLLCGHHHRLMHEGGWKVRFEPGEQPEFTSPRGDVLRERAPMSRGIGADPVETMVRDNESTGVRPDYSTPAARWKSDDAMDRETVLAAVGALDVSAEHWGESAGDGRLPEGAHATEKT